MAINLSESYGRDLPTWLVTITMPDITIRLASPLPEGPVVIANQVGVSHTYYGGLTKDPGPITYSLIGGTPSSSLEFYLPPPYGVAYPHRLQWDQAWVEIAHWFPGSSWEDRRIMLADKAQGISVGSARETVQLTVAPRTEDRSSLLSERTIISGQLWPDVADIPTGPTTQDDGGDKLPNQEYFKRAHQSEGAYYGEVIGYPRWAEAHCVGNEVGADQFATDLIPRKYIVSDGMLADVTSSRAMRYIHADGGPIEFGVSLEASTDPDGRNITTADQLPIFVTGVWAWYPIGYGLARDTTHGLGDNAWGNVTNFHLLRPGDQVKWYFDAEHDWVQVSSFVTTETTDTPSPSTTFRNIVRTYDDYGGSAGAGYDLIAIPLPQEGAPVYVECRYHGGMGNPSDPGTVLREAQDVLFHYLGRTQDLSVDLDSVRALPLRDYHIDGQILQGQGSVWAWLRADILPLLPVKETWGAHGLRFVLIDPQETVYRAALSLGREGTDGDRVGRRPIQDTSVVINQVTVLYDWDAARGRYRGAILTADTSEPQGTLADVNAIIVNDRALASQRTYGPRKRTIETQWTRSAVTAKALANNVINRYHHPRWQLTYDLAPRWGWLDLGDVVKMTDSDMGIGGELARIIHISHERMGARVTLEEMG